MQPGADVTKMRQPFLSIKSTILLVVIYDVSTNVNYSGIPNTIIFLPKSELSIKYSPQSHNV